jgi:uncharacterized protein (TIGR02646 family)
MKHIQKSREPRTLQQYRASADPSSSTLFDDFPDKDGLRRSLLKEQGYICCYCLKRIKGEPDKLGKPDTRIEHWAPQSLYPSLRLDYKNLLAACDGNEGKPKHLRHCDVSKGDQEISLDPTQPSCETQIFYQTRAGRICASDLLLQNDLNHILNLNIQTLKENRLAVLDSILNEMKREAPIGNWSASFIQRKINKLSQHNRQGYHQEYFAFAVFELKKMLARAK